MRLCFFIPEFSDGGAQKQCIYLLNELQRRPSLELSLILLHSGHIHEGLLDRSNITVFDLRAGSNFDPRLILQVRRVLRRTGADLVVSWLMSSDVITYFASRGLPVKWLMAERNSRYPPILRFKLRERVGRHADGIVSNSQAGDEYWRRLGARGRRWVADNVIEAGPSTPRPSGGPITYIGRLADQKNVLTLVEAFTLLARRDPSRTFVIAGDGELRAEIARRVDAAGLAGRIAVPGFVHDVSDVLARSSLLVTLSHYEGLPNVLLEAVAAGVPVVASAIPEHIAVLGGDYPLLVADWESAADAAKVIESALTTPPPPMTHAQARLARMSPREVGDFYVAMFSSLLNARDG